MAMRKNIIKSGICFLKNLLVIFLMCAPSKNHFLTIESETNLHMVMELCCIQVPVGVSNKNLVDYIIFIVRY